MNVIERQKQFLKATKEHFGAGKTTQVSGLYGVSNSAMIVEGGVLIGVPNLDSVKNPEAFIVATVMKFPPEDEVYFAVLIRNDITNFLARLSDLKRLGSKVKDTVSLEPFYEGAIDAVDAVDAVDESDESDESDKDKNSVKYSSRNNLVPMYLAKDGLLRMRNSGFWPSLQVDRSEFGQLIEPDEIIVSLYPPTASARRSLLAREFIGWLGTLAGNDKIHELRVWTDAATLLPAMRRMPATIPVADIEAAITNLGGHYPNGEVRRFHAALNFLSHKHFVILSGLSGTGKTQLALKYARAVHGLMTGTAADPLLFECPVRPEWTDPTGLTGYYDVLTNRYVVPTFLEAVLVATAHPDSPVFVILDEMNLARVEYYLSDVLSCIETQSALQLHSHGVPLEGTTGTSIRAEVPLPSNLFIIGTINVDETTNPVSDKVLDRASVIDMSSVDVQGFLVSLQARFPELTDARAAVEPKLTEILGLMQPHGFGFGYRVIEEMVRYHDFDARYLQSATSDVTDQLLVQKVLVKLRGSEKQRSLLSAIDKTCEDLPRSRVYIRKLLSDLEEFGSFQAMR